MESSTHTNNKKMKKLFDISHYQWCDLYDKVLQPVENDRSLLSELSLASFSYAMQTDLTDDTVMLRKLKCLIDACASQYNDVHYHSVVHGTHVLLNTAYLIHEWDKYMSKEEDKQRRLNSLEKMALLFAALIHDINHLGLFNSTLVRMKHDFSVMFNDQSVAEMRSLAVAFETLEKDECDFTYALDEEKKRLFRKIVIELVLCTDIADEGRRLLFDVKTGKHVNGCTDTSIVQDHTAAMMILLRMADIGSSTQSFACLSVWSYRFYLEQLKASKTTDQDTKGLVCFYDQQNDYLKDTVGQLLDKFKKIDIVDNDVMNSMLSHLKGNVQSWSEHGVTLVDKWKRECS